MELLFGNKRVSLPAEGSLTLSELESACEYLKIPFLEVKKKYGRYCKAENNNNKVKSVQARKTSGGASKNGRGSVRNTKSNKGKNIS